MESTNPTGRPNGEPGTAATAANDVDARVAALEAQLKAARDEQLRLLADADNQRKRAARDVEQARKFGAERLLADLLPVADSLEAALRTEGGDPARLREGVDMTLRRLLKALEANGLEPIEPLPGEPFDPALHQAMSTIETGRFDSGCVVQVFQKGYRLNERLLRPAMVAVAAEPLPPEDA
jgi:molecular chaperone GrpE